jgi:hypothetical protein
MSLVIFGVQLFLGTLLTLQPQPMAIAGTDVATLILAYRVAGIIPILSPLYKKEYGARKTHPIR